LWLSQAYRLEMLGEPTYLLVWAAGVVFFLSNCWILGEVMRAYRPLLGAVKSRTEEKRE
jgi:phosphatidylinositol glycan class M